MKSRYWLYSMVLLPVFSATSAMADCNTPTGPTVPTSQSVAENSLYYNPDLKEIKRCKGGSWQAVENKMAPFNPQGYPYIGANGLFVVTPCTVELGERCGGGLFAGDVNLVVSMPGCSDKRTISSGGWEDDLDLYSTAPGVRCPTDRNTIDFRRLRYATSAQPAATNFGAAYAYKTWKYSRRHGYANTHGDPRDATIKGYKEPSYADAFRFCAAMSVTVDGKTYNDWYVPSRFELRTLFNSLLRLGGNTAATSYVAANESGTDGTKMDLIDPAGGVNGIYSQPKNERRPIVRCVRRN